MLRIKNKKSGIFWIIRVEKVVAMLASTLRNKTQLFSSFNLFFFKSINVYQEPVYYLSPNERFFFSLFIYLFIYLYMLQKYVKSVIYDVYSHWWMVFTDNVS